MASSAASSVPQSNIHLDGDFDGASGASQRQPTLDHQCGVCSQRYVFFSQLAYINPADKMFAQLNKAAIARTVELAKGEGFQNKFENKPVVLACYKCCEKFHDTSYANEDGKLTSHWGNMQRSTKRIRLAW
jgi:hypothetical protein